MSHPLKLKTKEHCLSKGVLETNTSFLYFIALRSLSDSLVAQSVKRLPRNAGNLGSMPGSGRPPGEGNGNPLQYSCLENSMDGGAWWATVHGITKSRT